MSETGDYWVVRLEVRRDMGLKTVIEEHRFWEPIGIMAGETATAKAGEAASGAVVRVLSVRVGEVCANE